MATTTNYGWTTPDDTALVKDGASAIRTLGSSVDTTTKALNPSTTLGDIEYRSSTANTNTRVGIGTTGQALTVVGGVPAWAASPTSVLTTTGDTLYASGANTLARLGIGSTGNILTVAGGVPTWAAPAASGGITLITETTASALSSVTYGSIPSTYKDLLLVWDGLSASDSGTGFQIRINNDSGSNYYGKCYLATPSMSVVEGSGASTVIGESSQSMLIGTSGTNLARLGAGSFRIYNYASSAKKKRYDYQAAFYYQQLGAMRGGITIGSYDSTTAVTSIDIFRSTGSGTFSNATDTSIRLYGIS
jgi:hypothetical protein